MGRVALKQCTVARSAGIPAGELRSNALPRVGQGPACGGDPHPAVHRKEAALMGRVAPKTPHRHP